MEACVNQDSINRSLKVNKGVLLKAIETELKQTSYGGCKGPFSTFSKQILIRCDCDVGGRRKEFPLEKR